MAAISAPSVEELQRVGMAHGLDAVGVARAEVFESTLRDLQTRKADGLAADMQFTYRNPARSTDPSRALPGARSLVVAAKSYLREVDDAAGVAPDPAGVVARYVWEDHYAQLRIGLEAVAEVLDGLGWRSRLLIDDNALVDREAAYRAGLGWYGKNANLLLPGRGSWFVLGSVLTDAELPAAEPLEDGCGPCSRCLTSCPTDAIVAPGVIDARRCLAWLVQAKGWFPPDHRAALGTRIYGCDDCQEVCPPNSRAARSHVEISSVARRPWVPLLAMLDASDDELLSDYGVWYIPGREPRYLRRNALVALANTGNKTPAVLGMIGRYLGDPDPMLRGHAVWAAKRLGQTQLLAGEHHESTEADPDVIAEHRRDVAVVS